MGWLQLARLLGTIMSKVLGIIETDQLMDAGEAKATSANLERILDNVNKAIEVRKRVRSDPEYRKRVRERSTRPE